MITTEASNNKHNDQGALSAQPLQTPQVTEVSLRILILGNLYKINKQIIHFSLVFVCFKSSNSHVLMICHFFVLQIQEFQEILQVLLTWTIYDTTQEATIGDLSITPAYESRKMLKKTIVLQSRYVHFPTNISFKCNKAVCKVYDAVCSCTRRSSNRKYVYATEFIFFFFPLL